MKRTTLDLGCSSLLQFEALARLCSLKAAAHELGLSQPAITHALNALETKLGVKLCVRSRSEFLLTEAGKRLFLLASSLRADLRNYQSFINNDRDFVGTVSIGMSDNLDTRLFNRQLCKLAAAHPRMKLALQTFTTETLQQLIASGEVDLGIGIFTKKHPELVYSAIGSETICHFLSERHPLWTKKTIEKADLLDNAIAWNDIVTRDRRLLEREIFSKKRIEGMEIRFYSNALSASLVILSSGLAVVPLPSEYLASLKVDFRYRKLDSIFPPYSIRIEVAYRKEFAKACPPLMDFLKSLNREGLKSTSKDQASVNR